MKQAVGFYYFYVFNSVVNRIQLGLNLYKLRKTQLQLIEVRVLTDYITRDHTVQVEVKTIKYTTIFAYCTRDPTTENTGETVKINCWLLQ